PNLRAVPPPLPPKAPCISFDAEPPWMYRNRSGAQPTKGIRFYPRSVVPEQQKRLRTSARRDLLLPSKFPWQQWHGRADHGRHLSVAPRTILRNHLFLRNLRHSLGSRTGKH